MIWLWRHGTESHLDLDTYIDVLLFPTSVGYGSPLFFIGLQQSAQRVKISRRDMILLTIV